jgi:anti-anti-sigma factor
MPDRPSRRHVLVAPQEKLVVGGPAEEYERLVQDLFRSGCRHLIADLRAVTGIDSAGVRTLVRSHTSAQRLGGTFTLVAPQPRVRQVLQLAHLESVFDIRESLDQVPTRRGRMASLRLTVFGTALCLALWWAGVREAVPVGSALTGAILQEPIASAPVAHALRAVEELMKLIAAGLIGLLVTAVQRRFLEKPMAQAMQHAQVLLCVSGALVMMIINDNVARAFGIAGAAAVIRFRTPVEDPKDITILFLLMALGMSTGLGAFAIASAGTAFLCVFLFALQYVGGGQRRIMMVEIGAPAGQAFPLTHVQRVFARNEIVFEPREMAQGKMATLVYYTTLDPSLSLEDVSAQLLAGDSGITSVHWATPKRNE